VLLSTYGGRGDVEPLVDSGCGCGNSARTRRLCAPPDCAERLAEVGAIRTDEAAVAATLLLDRS
jgi:vancomycin aglycone glucosyltransferase